LQLLAGAATAVVAACDAIEAIGVCNGTYGQSTDTERIGGGAWQWMPAQLYTRLTFCWRRKACDLPLSTGRSGAGFGGYAWHAAASGRQATGGLL
jgi:hypothetical protein